MNNNQLTAVPCLICGKPVIYNLQDFWQDPEARAGVVFCHDCLNLPESVAEAALAPKVEEADRLLNSLTDNPIYQNGRGLMLGGW